MYPLRRGDGGGLRRPIEGAGNGLVLAADAKKLFSQRLGKPKVAVCPQCGEISLYMEHPEALSR